jgi:erythromycin esterase-like protein
MWRNADVVDFVGWLRAHNEARAPHGSAVGFYGLDLYSLHASMEAVLRYLRIVDPDAARRAARRYGCFDRFGDDPQAYGYASTVGLAPTCETEVVSQLIELRRSAAEYADRDGRVAVDDLFFAEQNARLVANAERYYRAMFGSREASWNLRDQHMAETLDALDTHFVRTHGHHEKIVVWAHNSHLGDARATEMARSGELNVGQLVRQKHGSQAVLLGFTTYAGTVTAASNWDEPAQCKVVRPAIAKSYESLFHDVGVPNFYLDLGRDAGLAAELNHARLERAIGVIYRPETERLSHYFHARLPAQFDAVLHYDQTRAVEPLERSGTWEPGELPETYPTAL